MDDAQKALYRSLVEKAREWAASKGLSDEYAMGALNAMWYTIAGAVTAAPNEEPYVYTHEGDWP